LYLYFIDIYFDGRDFFVLPFSHHETELIIFQFFQKMFVGFSRDEICCRSVMIENSNRFALRLVNKGTGILF